MGLGETYVRMMRLPGRRARRPLKVADVTRRRRAANAFVVPAATLLAGRGVIGIALTDAGTLVRWGVAAAALVAWITARWHLSSAGRRRTPATVLGVALLVASGCAVAMHYDGFDLEAVQMVGLRRGTLGALVVAAMASIATAMLGLRPATPTKTD